MKIRTDFVTNSSSSSFVSINIEDENFSDFIKKYKSSLSCEFDVNGESISYRGEGYFPMPHVSDSVNDYLWSLLLELIEDGNDTEKKKIMNEVKAQKKEITFKPESFNVNRIEESWGSEVDEDYWEGDPEAIVRVNSSYGDREGKIELIDNDVQVTHPNGYN